MIPAREFIRMCRKNMRRLKAADSTGAEATGADLLLRALIFRRLLRREILARDERHVGILLPPSVGGTLANVALALDSRVGVNLNYTFTSEIMNYCIAQAGIKHVLTTRQVMGKFDLKLDAEVVYLDDFKDRVTLVDKLTAAVQAWATPTAVLERQLGLMKIDPDDMLTLVFTSGSTGRPKGVMLSHRNISSNMHSFADLFHFTRDDRLLGVLPFFHVFGYTTTLWWPMVDSLGVAYHFSPLEPRPIGKMVRRYGVTAAVTAPTFLKTWIKRAEPKDWATLDTLITGAEKLPKELADQCEAKLGVRPWEGYGATELSPVVSCNVPPERCLDKYQPAGREGTIGQALAGLVVKIADPETFEQLGPDQSGMLMVKGPNVMKGYYQQPELTAEVMRDGWYITGDIAQIDQDGFISITGRQSRMSKIGGEMVPHILVEEAIYQAIAELTGPASDPDNEQDDQQGYPAAVAGVADERKGEKLIVLHTELPATPQEICQKLKEQGLPALWVPSPANFRQVDAIPELGTGKLDLYRIKQMAEQLVG